MQFWKTLPTVHRVLLLCGIGFLLDTALPYNLAEWTALDPNKVVGNYELWRLLSYPFFGIDFWRLLSASMLLYFFGPEIEHLMQPGRFLRLTIGFFLLHAVVYTVLMYGNISSLAGPYAYALALLATFAYVYPNAEFSLFGIIAIRAWVFSLIFAVFSIMPGIVAVAKSDLSLSVFLTGDVAGIIFGLAFAHVYFRKYRIPLLADIMKSRAKVPVQPVSRPVAPVVRKTRTEFSPLKGKAVQTTPLYSEQNDTSLDEQRLNDILDKISESGRASLTDEEVQFLEEYSRRL